MNTEERSDIVKISAWKYVAAVSALLALIGLLIFFREDKTMALWFAGTSAVLLVVKQILSTFARDNVAHAKTLEDWASIASLFAVVFAAPAVFAVISINAG